MYVHECVVKGRTGPPKSLFEHLPLDFYDIFSTIMINQAYMSIHNHVSKWKRVVFNILT